MLEPIIWMTLITFIPGLELRASIPYGFFGKGGAPVASTATIILACFLANIVLGWLVFALMGPVFKALRRWSWFDRRVWPALDRTQHKLKPYVDKYGEMGVAVFIGVPLPGTGVYTGAFGSYLLGLDRRKFAIANVVGVVIAGVAVTALCLLLRAGVVGHDSWVAKLFIKDRTPAAEAPAVPGPTTP
jgi:uncharacterized membrane protein